MRKLNYSVALIVVSVVEVVASVVRVANPGNAIIQAATTPIIVVLIVAIAWLIHKIFRG